jgi:hypothetical protein
MAEENLDTLGDEQPAEGITVPEAEPQDAGEGSAGHTKVESVPFGALHEQRTINRQLREELAKSREAQERMENTFQRLLVTFNEKPMPKYEEDPLGHTLARNETLERELKSVNEKLDGFGRQSQQAAFLTQVTSALAGSEAEFRSQHPDYDSAVKYLKDVTRADLQDQGLSAAQIEDYVNQGKLALAHAALQQGKNPSEVIYERARRYGFKAAAQQNADDKIASVAKGQQMGKTVQGGSAAGITLRDLTQLPEDQLDAIVADEAKFQALIRGQMVR